jgi:lipopolysaccharide/colanic/teichoic acid biosynthesis glycosyltransferase
MATIQVEHKQCAELFARPVPRWKRAVDLACSSLLLIAASPIMLAMALYIKIMSPGPVFFRQARVGHGGRPFEMLKFRTMHVGADVTAHKKYMAELIRNGESADKPMIKRDEQNPAIIPFGNIIRKSCVDELPQIFNVFKGDMSLVGPRPVIPYEADEFLHWHHGRFDVLPGLTGLWQVMGKNSLTFNEMIRLDVRYSREMSPVLDAAIMLRTPAVIVGQLTGSALGKRARGGQPETVAR